MKGKYPVKVKGKSLQDKRNLEKESSRKEKEG